jgi:7,8-dihydropterin-6-yl-methyl-4-(beta-D-ribofuranosyl)aminobenzene 5'-phosphate synthase
MTIDLTVLFNDLPQDERLITAHGMACLIEGMEKTVLLDTGCDGHILLSNMKVLGKDPAKVEVVVISHMHWDHMGGLFEFLRASGPVDLYLPKEASGHFVTHAEMLGAKVTSVHDPLKIAAGIHSTGELKGKVMEQGVVLETGEGPVVVTGCAHPGIVEIVAKAGEIVGGTIELVAGGFHLLQTPDEDASKVVQTLRDMGVNRMAPSHCTGSTPITLFREAWQGNFVELACGGVVSLRAA